MVSGSDCLPVDEPEAQRIATTLNLTVRDAGLDGTGGASMPADLSFLSGPHWFSPPTFHTGPVMMHSSRVPSLNRIAAACCALFALAAAPLAHAQPQPPAPPRPVAHVSPTEHPEERLPELTLQASASADVQQDTVRITLAAEFDAESQAKATTDLSAVLDEAVKRAQGAKGISVHTSGYNIWPNTNDKGKIQNWRARGEIVLESKDFAATSALASKLSDKVAISQISFSLSREAREAAEKKLLTQAADAFLARAQAAAKAFGYSSYRVQQLELSGGGSAVPVPRPMMAMAKGRMGGAEAFADAPLEANQVTVTLSVSGTVSLQ